MSFINQFKERFGVEPICQTLQVAPSTYYAALSRPPSARRLRDEELKVEIARVHRDNFDVYGVEKVWKQLHDLEGLVHHADRGSSTWPFATPSGWPTPAQSARSVRVATATTMP